MGKYLVEPDTPLRNLWYYIRSHIPHLPHKHQFRKAEWDRERLGPDVTDMTEYTAWFHRLYRCRCGEEMTLKRRGNI
ncbi:hypothetical protein LCGC14_1099240 [marine sediment metagenome]|uniref:Uncharacterized protein n=1 Tax=marine sediment metagenome TaxID=412755 RepID=A0A0F9PT58_9ZZZZ